ncbi:hypothetical protein CDAR_568391 [Caerostris darwini]|uniref:Uncharacterized protein n=1 Tax=Caerostris darwini TaxID=1538125 RepID=A0AAV4PL39_9ARAC|nr:hypothetical protein CDAR_568391 [Caerostris darwini]
MEINISLFPSPDYTGHLEIHLEGNRILNSLCSTNSPIVKFPVDHPLITSKGTRQSFKPSTYTSPDFNLAARNALADVMNLSKTPIMPVRPTRRGVYNKTYKIIRFRAELF